MEYPDNSHITTPVLDKLSFYLGLLASFLILCFLVSAWLTGWSASHFWGIILLTLTLSQSLLTKHLPYLWKASLLIGLFFLAGLIGLRMDAIYSFSIPLFVTSLVLANVFLGLTSSLFIMILITASIGIFGWLYTINALEPLNQVGDIFVSTRHWAISIAAFLLVLGVILFIVCRIRLLLENKMMEISKVNQQLMKTYQEIQAIREIIPVCAKCKNIRDDKGYWIHVSKFLSDYPGIEVQENLCQECATLDPTQAISR